MRALCGVSFIRARIPLMWAPPSCPNQHPSPYLVTHHLRDWVSTSRFQGDADTQTMDSTVWPQFFRGLRITPSAGVGSMCGAPPQELSVMLPHEGH